MFDTLIVDAEIVDGTGRLRFNGDIGIIVGRIANIAQRSPNAKRQTPNANANESDAGVRERAFRTIEARGRVASPGFIDLHLHANFSIQGASAAETQLMQGITTSLVGNCGSSPFPARSLREVERDNQHLEATFFGEWTDAEGYINALDETRPGINIVIQVGLSAIRSYCLGPGDVRPTTRWRSRAPNRLHALSSQMKTPPASLIFSRPPADSRRSMRRSTTRSPRSITASTPT